MSLPSWLEELIKVFKKEKKSSKVAKERLQLVIVHDRSQEKNTTIEKLKEDLIELLSKYRDDVDTEEMDFVIKADNHRVSLVASIPLKTKATSKH
ncbi:MAG: cell division topological specificity factor MinE [bacterium]|nr:cell division topological specificity factor MinE [bacterium]